MSSSASILFALLFWSVKSYIFVGNARLKIGSRCLNADVQTLAPSNISTFKHRHSIGIGAYVWTCRCLNMPMFDIGKLRLSMFECRCLNTAYSNIGSWRSVPKVAEVSLFQFAKTPSITFDYVLPFCPTLNIFLDYLILLSASSLVHLLYFLSKIL